MHTPVLLKEVIKYLDIKPGGKYIDATFGMGGHSQEILKRGGKVLGIDKDQFPITNFQKNVKGQMSKVKCVVGSFGDIEKIAKENGFERVDGVLFDLGFGSHQLDDPERGFSFQKGGPLDMRYNISSKQITAGEIINKYPEEELVRVFKEYGEEKLAKIIAKKIVEQRKKKQFKTTDELFAVIKNPDTARRIFQALRIEVNDELAQIEKALPQALELLRQSGRLVVISFHSLEDRIVKNFMREQAKDCICPPEVPVCRCDKQARVKILTRKPVTASGVEIQENPRSKSAKLRSVEKL